MNWWHNRSIRFKAFTGIGLILLPLLGGIIFGVAKYVQGELWQREIRAAENLNAIVSSLVTDAMMEGRKDIVQDTLVSLGNNVGGQFDGIAIYDDQSVLTSFATGFPGGRNLDKENYDVNILDPTCWACHQLPPEERPTMTIISIEGQDILRSVVPLYNETRCQTCHGTGQHVLGDSIVDLRLDQFEQASQTVSLGLSGTISIAVVLLIFMLFQFSRRVIISPLDELVEVSQAMTGGELDRRVQVYSRDEIGQVGQAFNTMATQVSGLVHELEQRVNERTQALEQRSAYLESSAEVSRTLASILDKDDLIRQSVDLIREQFNLYYVGLFLVDENNQWAALQAGTGEAGQAMLAEKHRLKIGEGMIGWCIQNAQSRIALDIGEDAVRFENPFLPETRSEGALPLRSRGRVLGALTVQSNQPAAFDQDIINTLQTMADQIAITLDNADLFARFVAARDAERRAYGDLRTQDWRNLTQRQSTPKFIVSEDGNLQLSKAQQSPDTLQAIQSGQTMHDDGMTVILPIKSYGQILGGIKLRKPANGDKWTQEELELVDVLSEQLSIALESARMLETSQRRAALEQAIGKVSSKIGESTKVEAILRSTVQELGQQLGDTEVILELESDQEDTGART